MLFQRARIREALLPPLTISVALQSCNATYVAANSSNRLGELTGVQRFRNRQLSSALNYDEYLELLPQHLHVYILTS